ncbi:Major Facilitator Superfamily protein [uncultured Alphaproteobacteria bacterium]|uniref:Major Facilitator Superfamily protein n=1 Tax=uncultured Alphaproteobacteria bacterium TaxID=91750 RepID=A0A212J0M0_9PROT|nr:Major Facilitator Superfamily protein [uncultured Alphaproteobacteria bacterium]
MPLAIPQKLRLNALLLSLGVLVVSLGFNVLLSVSTLDTLAKDLILSGYRSSGQRLVQSIERGLRFGKPLESYAGLDEMLAEVRHTTRGVLRIEISAAEAPDPGGEVGDAAIDRTPHRTAEGYRIVLPIRHNTEVGRLTIVVDAREIDSVKDNFLRWSLALLAAACLVVGIVLHGRLESASARGDGSPRHGLGRLLLVIVGGTQVLYSCGTLALFDGFVGDIATTKADILAQTVERDFEYLIHKGVDVVHLKGKEQALAQLVAANRDLAGAALLAPDGTLLAQAGDLPSAAPTVDRSLNAYWPSRFRQREEIMRLRLAIDPHVITSRLTRLTLDLATSLTISFLLLLELSKLLGLILAKRSAAPSPPEEQSVTAQALRVAGFVFFLGYDMGISFIPLLARKLYAPVWGLSEEVVIGLPISMEMICAGIALLLSGHLSARHGWRKVLVAGALSAALGLLTGGFATSLPMLILGRAAAGFGFGLTLMAAQIGTLGQANAAAGMASVFAGIFSGSICGAAAGAMLADHLSFGAALATGGAVTLFSACAVLLGKPAAPDATAVRAAPVSGNLRLLRDPGMHVMLLFVGIPVSICLTGFLHYLMPLQLANAHVEQSDIGRTFMVYGLCFITAGPWLGRWIDRRNDKALFLTLSGLLSGLSLLVAARATGMPETVAAVVFLGLAQCIVAPASMLCLLTLPSAQALGRERSAAIYRGLERLGQVAGPVVIGMAVVAVGATRTLLLVGGAVCGAAMLFHALWRLRSPRR